MTFTEFMSILNGEYKETAGTTAKNQCVDLANAYIKFVLELPVIEWANAVDFPSKAGDKYEYILNTPTGVPSEGDLIIWGGTYGHIAIFIEGNSNRFTSFDENFPTGSPCHVQEHTYLSPKVLGWLHPKVQVLDLQGKLTQAVADRNRNWDWFIGLCDTLKTPQVYEVAKAEIEKLIKLEDVVREKDQTITLKEQEITRMKEELSTIQSDLQKASTANTEAQTAIAELKQVVDEYKTRAEEEEKIIIRLGDRIEELKKVNPIESYNGVDLVIIGIKRIFGR